jgi:hypothetical protein
VHLIDVLNVELDSFQAARLGVDITRGQGDRARGAGRHQLHEAVILVDLHVLLDAKTDLVDVERLRAVNIGHRNGDQFKTQIHCGSSCTTLTLIGQHLLFVHFQTPADGSARGTAAGQFLVRLSRNWQLTDLNTSP